MHRHCELRSCTHYAIHTIRSSDGWIVMSCHTHFESVYNIVRKFSDWWVKLSVSTSSAVVEGDLRAWRTRSTIAYDVKRQIGA